MSISEADVRHVASLARLELVDERIPPLVHEMNRILDYVGVLQRFPLDSSPMQAGMHVPDATVHSAPLRADEVGAVPLARPIADFAPAERDGFLLVPRLASHA